MKSNQTKGQLDVLLLSVIARAPGHGYQVITTMRELSGGEFDLPEGTVYPRLHRLEADGLISGSWELINDRRRRVYCLTESGAQSLSAGRAEWGRFALSVSSVLGQPAW